MTHLTFEVDSEQEAESLMYHHLRLAALLFESTPTRLKLPKEDFASSAFMAFCEAMEKLYQEGY